MSENNVSVSISTGQETIPERAARRFEALEKEIERAINGQGVDNALGTPDFVLAEYLIACLRAYEKIHNDRAFWFRPQSTPGLHPVRPYDLPGEEQP